MKRTLSLILVVFSLALLIAGFALFLFEDREPTAPHITDLREEIGSLRRLTGSEYRYRDVVYYSEETRLLGIPTGRHEVLFSVDIVVRAGVDLSRGFTAETGEDGARLFITLPAAEIFLVDAEEDSIEQYFSVERLGRLDWLDVGDELTRAKDANRDDAIERGILSTAEAQARNVLIDLARSAGFDSAEIRFRPIGELRG